MNHFQSFIPGQTVADSGMTWSVTVIPAVLT